MPLLVAPSPLRSKALAGIGKLPPFSPVLARLLASLAKDDIMVAELADSIEKDTVLTGSVMRMVNSAAYGRMGSVSSVRHAITILGTNRLRNIVLGLSVCNMMAQVKLPSGWSSKQFNVHAVSVAVLSDLIAQEIAVDYSEGAFVAGLLHDVGKLLLAVTCPEEYSAAIVQMQQQQGGMCEVEAAMFGVTHAELSLSVLESWKLPLPVQTAAHLHHSPEPAHADRIPLSLTIHVADSVVNAVGFPAIAGQRPPEDPVALLEQIALSGAGDRILAAFKQDMEAMAGLL